MPATAPPGPRGYPIVGILPEMARDPLSFLTRTFRAYGDLSTFRMGSRQAYLLAHPDLIEEVLLGRAKDVMKDWFTQQLSALLGQGLVTSEGDLWKRQRRLAAPSFQRGTIARYAQAMVELTEALLDRFAQGQRLDLHRELMGLTLDIVARTMFGADVGNSAALVGRTLDVCMDQFEAEARRLHHFIPRWITTPARRRFRNAVAELDVMLAGVIEAQRRKGPDDTLLGRLLAARDDDGSDMSNALVRDEVVTTFLAGHETTALALTYTFFALSRHPAAAQRLRDELAEVLGGRPPEVGDIEKLRYTDAVVRESMRLYPPAWTIGRQTLGPSEIRGFAIPTGAQLLLSQWVVHRDARWFEEPDAFRPERWLDGLEKRLPRFAYFPFGGGPRVCIGNHFAMMEAVLLLASMASRAHFEVDAGHNLRLHASITMRPLGGLPVTVQLHEGGRTAAQSTLGAAGAA